MKVSELIEVLKTFPPEMEVLVDGYEEGYDDIASVSKQSASMFSNKYRDGNGFWQGRHAAVRFDGDYLFDSLTTIILISR